VHSSFISRVSFQHRSPFNYLIAHCEPLVASLSASRFSLDIRHSLPSPPNFHGSASPVCFHDVKSSECHPNCNKAFFGILLHRQAARSCLLNLASSSSSSSSSSSLSSFSSCSIAFSLLVHTRLEGVTMPRSGPPRRGTVVTISNEMKY